MSVGQLSASVYIDARGVRDYIWTYPWVILARSVPRFGGGITLISPFGNSEVINSIAAGVFPAFIMMAGVQLGLFTELKDGPKNAEQIAQSLGLSLGKLEPLLFALTVIELLQVHDDFFSNTEEADSFLVQGRATYRGELYEKFPDRWQQIMNAAETVRTGMPQGKIDYSTMSQEELYAFYGSQRAADTANTVRMLMERYDFSPCRHLLDVGGGTGGLAIAFAVACPELQASVVDLPSVTPITRRFIKNENLENRVHVITADVTTESLSGSFDVVVMRNFIPVISRTQARQALRNVSEALEPGGVVYLVDLGTLDDSRLSPPACVIHNIWFTNVFDDGGARTEQERIAWLTEAGLKSIERATLPGGAGMMVAHKPN